MASWVKVLHRTSTLQQALKCIALQSRFCSVTPKENDKSLKPENESLLENLNLLGVDVKMARQRQPGVFRKIFTNEQGLAGFLQSKGASRSTVASIISRYPRAITRSLEHLEQRWQLWRNVFQTDEEIVSILERSPESFFRSSDNENLEKNITFLSSLGLNKKHLHRLLTTAPRTFSNSLELNRQMVEFLEDICVEMGGNHPEQFAKDVVSRNVYILIRSTKRVKANIDHLRASLKLSDSELLDLLHGPGAEILDLSNEYLKNNFTSLQQKMRSVGCGKVGLKKLIMSYPVVLYTGAATLNTKLDCLLKGGITMQQILDKPKVLDYSTHNITAKLEELHRIGFDFKENGIHILDLSRKRFEAKLEKLSFPPQE
uniref:transcription termination factor 1, mitochondrial n=1 Tax=Doryrhamphus excisus TaxID=161450 RepID=UPI0025AE0F1A|nr:transcription termination factor 1, mitochondrial [Doryrhamphus excisus]XP_057903014.1 transcription termination factor 1, mitochondrial [Doryrhamphus excisus]